MATLSKNGKPIGRPKGSKKKVPLPASFQASPILVHPSELPEHKRIVDLSPTLAQSPEWQAISPQERVFLYKYFMSGFDETTSYLETLGNPDISKDVAKRSAHHVLNKPPMLKALQALVDYFLAERKISYVPKILSLLEAQAFYDPSEIVDSTGELRVPLADLPPYLRLCVEGIETKFYGKDADRSVTVVKLVNRQKALESLARYVALFSGDVTNNVTINAQNAMLQQNMNLPRETQSRLAAIFDSAVLARSAPPKGAPMKGKKSA